VVNPATTPNSIQVNVSGNAANLSWRGGAVANPSAWDHATANWFNTGTSLSDVFYNGDMTTFDDNGTVTAVNVIGPEQPVSISMANNTKSYVFSGTGLLTGPLDAEGSGALTLSLSQAPAFSAITLNSETLVYALSNGLVNTISVPITGSGTFIQGGTNTLVLAADSSSTFTGSIVITNGVLQYASAGGLGLYTSPLYATNGGTLDLHGVSALLKNVNISGDGYNGRGALVDTSASGFANEGIHNLTLLGDASVMASNRFDIYGGAGGGTMTGNGYKFTLNSGIVLFNIIGDIGVGDIHVKAGRLGFQGPVTMGDPLKTITVESNATVTFYSAANAANPNSSEDKVMVLNGNTQIDSAGSSNNFQGPITLNGTNNLMGLRQDLHLWGSIGGSGGMSVGNSSVGAGSGTLWLDGANTYTGATVVSNAHKLVVGASSSLGSSSLIQVNSNATLDVSAPASLSLSAGQTLIGAGTVIGGNLVFGTGSTLAPGFPDGNTYTLTMNGNLTLQSGSTNLVVVNKTTSVANDTVASLTSVNMSGTLVINSVGSALAAGDAIQLFSASSGYTISIAKVIPATPGTGLIWDYSTLNSDGKLRVASNGPPSSPTNIVYNVLANQASWSLSWPLSYTGWTLQGQTNNGGAGLTTNWHDVPGSTATNVLVIPISEANGSVFFRMILK
jgi:autotransporter-associated beta strand protein